MLTLEISILAEVAAGVILGGPEEGSITGVVIDSRDVRPGSAFIALPGERTDGHSHVADAVARGARAVIVSRDEPQVRADALEGRGVALVLVDDGALALQRLAAYHRSRLDAAVIGITGSTGKTTTKDFVRSVLSTTLRTEATAGNRNNELGVPLTILDTRPDTEALVLEMAMRGAGQIRQLCDLGRPDVGAVTNIGISHVEVLGSEEAIAEAKAELVECVSSSGRVFLNGDDAWSREIGKRAVAPVTWFGLESGNDVTAREITVAEDGTVSFVLIAPGVEQPVALRVLGRHNAYNALTAAAIGLHLGVPPERIAIGLRDATMTGMRMEVFQTASGVLILNDAYNANPTSMRAALHTLADVTADGGRRIAVLGDMAELGSLTELAHFQLGEEVARVGLDMLVTVGPRARRIADGAHAEGMSIEAIRSYDDAEDALASLGLMLDGGDVVLVKASRVMGLEAVVEGIVAPNV